MKNPFSTAGSIHRVAIRLGMAAMLLAAIGTNAPALTFNFTFTPTSTSQDIAGFNAAAAFWSSKLGDNVVLNMNVGTAALGSGILASTGSSNDFFAYDDVRNALGGDATSAEDVMAVNSLSSQSPPLQ